MKKNLFGAILILATMTLFRTFRHHRPTIMKLCNRVGLMAPDRSRRAVREPTAIRMINCGRRRMEQDRFRRAVRERTAIRMTNCGRRRDGTGPIQTCRPGTNCNPDDQLRQTARWNRTDPDVPSGNELQLRMTNCGRRRDGTGPIQTCRPGTHCNPDDQLRQMADGTGPIQTCRPGTNCNPDDQLRQMAMERDRSRRAARERIAPG